MVRFNSNVDTSNLFGVTSIFLLFVYKAMVKRINGNLELLNYCNVTLAKYLFIYLFNQEGPIDICKVTKKYISPHNEQTQNTNF